MSNLTIRDIQSIHAEVSQEDLEYIKETYGSIGKGLKMTVKNGPLEKAIGMVNKLIEENSNLKQ